MIKNISPTYLFAQTPPSPTEALGMVPGMMPGLTGVTGLTGLTGMDPNAVWRPWGPWGTWWSGKKRHGSQNGTIEMHHFLFIFADLI